MDLEQLQPKHYKIGFIDTTPVEKDVFPPKSTREDHSPNSCSLNSDGNIPENRPVYIGKPQEDATSCICNVSLTESLASADVIKIVPSNAPVPSQISAPPNSTLGDASGCSRSSVNENNEAFLRVSLVSSVSIPKRPPTIYDIHVEEKFWVLVPRDGKVCFCQVEEKELGYPNNTWLLQTPSLRPPSIDNCGGFSSNVILYSSTDKDNLEATHRLVLGHDDDDSINGLSLADVIPLPGIGTPLKNNPNGSTLAKIILNESI